MSINIVDLVKNQVSQDLISKASAFLGESEGSTSKAVSGLIPSILGGVVNKGAQSEANAQQLLDSAKEAKNSGILGNLSSLFGNADLLSKGSGLFSNLFGGQSNTIIDTISNFAGVKKSSSSSLISLFTPLALGLLGKHADDNKLGASGFSSFLNSQKSNVQSALPSGLGSIGSLFGFGSGVAGAAREKVQDIKESAASTYNYVEDKAEKAGGGMKWLLPLLLLAALVFLLWLLMGKGCNNADTAPVTDDSLATETSAEISSDTATTAVATPAVASEPTEQALTKVILPSGKELEAFPGGVEDQLVQYLKSGDYANATEEQLKQKWFNFDDLNFEFGTTKLTADSKRQVDNIVSILKEFSDVKVKLGAYTDKKGNDAANKKLSQQRADALKAALSAVSSQITGAEGYGEEFATVDENASDEERKVDRKTAIRLAK